MKKFVFSLLTLTLMSSAYSQDYTPRDYPYHIFNDISKDGLTKDQLFKSMNKKLMDLDNSNCANRALMWLWDIKDKFNVDGGKVFVFYTGKYGAVGRTDWWFHVAPVVNEKNKLWVMEGAFPGILDRPLSMNQWFKAFTGSETCKEIGAENKDLVNLMFSGVNFPKETSLGKNDCYYKVVPAGYWYPSSVAMNLLGQDSTGAYVTFERDQMLNTEVNTACLESAKSKMGKKRKCKKFSGL